MRNLSHDRQERGEVRRADQGRAGIPVELKKGRSGQFEIVVDGQPVVSRKGGLLARLVGRPWPYDDEVLAAVRRAMAPSDG